jgi:N-acetylglucosamine-6-sulfatase
LLIRRPGVPAGEKREELVANVDLAPPIADWADASPPENPDGRSLAPLLSTSRPDSWREALLIEHFVGSDWAGLRTPRYTYVEHEGGEKELYDLKEDPHQIDNLYESADAALLSTLHSRLESLEDCAGTKCLEAENRRIP